MGGDDCRALKQSRPVCFKSDTKAAEPMTRAVGGLPLHAKAARLSAVFGQQTNVAPEPLMNAQGLWCDGLQGFCRPLRFQVR